MNLVPVLFYHHIAPHPGDTVTVTPEVFSAQMRYLAERGYRFLSAGELVDHVSGSKPVQEKSVAITFDDGWLDNYLNAYPVLVQFDIKATMFVVTARTDAASLHGCTTPLETPVHEEAKRQIREGHAEGVVLDWPTIRVMARGGLMEFHSHTVSHQRCADLPPEELVRELTISKRVVERELGCSCTYLCWPYGSFNDHAVQVARQLGYQALFTTVDGFCAPGSDPLFISRIEAQDSLEWLQLRLETG